MGATALTMTPDAGVALVDQTVLVRGDSIEALGPAESVAVPPDATVVDGTGLYLMPGLTDLHSHVGTNYSEFTNRRPPDDELQAMAEVQLFLYLANGVTTILGNGDFVEPVVRWGPRTTDRPAGRSPPRRRRHGTPSPDHVGIRGPGRWASTW